MNVPLSSLRNGSRGTNDDNIGGHRRKSSAGVDDSCNRNDFFLRTTPQQIYNHFTDVGHKHLLLGFYEKESRMYVEYFVFFFMPAKAF